MSIPSLDRGNWRRGPLISIFCFQCLLLRVAKSHLRWFISDAVIKKVLYFLTGTQNGMNQFCGELPSEKLGRAYVFLNKSAKVSFKVSRRGLPTNRLTDLSFNNIPLSPQFRLCLISTGNGRSARSSLKC